MKRTLSAAFVVAACVTASACEPDSFAPHSRRAPDFVDKGTVRQLSQPGRPDTLQKWQIQLEPNPEQK